MYTLKSIAQRGSMLGAAVALVAAAVVPSAAVFADALNPLTDRSLMLSSSAPGYIDTDGSNYSNAQQNPASAGNPNVPGTYAPAGSGPNGKKTGETFSFKVSSAGVVKGLSFQYCTTAAGLCKAPGNNSGDARDTDRQGNSVAHPAGKSDLDIVGTFTPQAASTAPAVPTFSSQYEGISPAEPQEADYTDGAADADYIADMALYDAYQIDYDAYLAGAGNVDAGKFSVRVNGASAGTGWTMKARNAEDNSWLNGGSPSQDGLTGKNNYMTLSSASGTTLSAGDKVEVIFAASESVYITNPGEGSFFVKINTYNSDEEATLYTDKVPLSTPNPNVIDGGVTVANVMADSIHIVTKVLETMSFSVGIQNPDTVDRDGSTATQHGTCEPISQTSTVTGLSNNRINLGNPNAESSLETGTAYDANSYWRLSSNSSGGASVYYSGTTLSNTSGDQIADMETEQLSNPGTEQFGLGFVDAGTENFALANDTFQAGWVTPRSYPFITLDTQTGAPYNTLASQPASIGYDEATGRINVGAAGPATEPIEAKFKFLKSSLTIPEPIAQQNEQVISCATAKMRYVANIGADTPAGVYTTKVNYLAAPQY